MAERILSIALEAKYKGRGFREAGQEARQFGRNLDDLITNLVQAEIAFSKAQNESIALKAEFKRLRQSGEGTADMFRDLSQRIDRAQAVELEAINTTRRAAQAFDQWEEETGELNTDLRELEARLTNAEGHITGVDHKVRTMSRGFHELGQSAGEANHKLGRIDSQTQKLNDNFIKFSAVGSLVAEGIEEAARAVVEFGKESVQAFHDFDRQSREIFTLIPEASAQMRAALTGDILALGTELGRLPEEALPAVYNALSAGIPKDNVLDAVRTASEAARAGVADLDTTLKLGVAILNAKVAGVDDLNDVYDQLFFTIKNGVVTLPELNEGFNKVTSVAGEAGVSLQDISAALVVMTRQGDSAQEAFDLLAIMLTQLATGGTTLADAFEQAAGTSFRRFIAEGGSLAGAMQLLQAHAQRTGVALGDMLGGGSPFFRDTQAARGALELTGKHLQDLIMFSHQASQATGMMGEAAAEMGQSAELGALQYKAAVEELKIAAGAFLAEHGTGLVQNATEFVKVFSGNRAREVHNLVTEIEDLGEAGRKLARQYVELNSFTGVLSGGFSIIRDETRALAAQTGDYTGGNEALLASLQAVFGESVTLKNGYVLLNGLQLESIATLTELNKAYLLQEALLAGSSADIALYDRKLQTLTPTLTANAAATNEANTATDGYKSSILAMRGAYEQVGFSQDIFNLGLETARNAMVALQTTQDGIRLENIRKEFEATGLKTKRFSDNVLELADRLGRLPAEVVIKIREERNSGSGEGGSSGGGGKEGGGDKTPAPPAPPSTPPEEFRHHGGRFNAGDVMVVGDGPGGRILPTTELVAFDRPGAVFSGRDTQQLLRALGSRQAPPISITIIGGGRSAMAIGREAAARVSEEIGKLN